MGEDGVEDIGPFAAVLARNGEPQEAGIVEVAVVLVREAPRWIVDDGAVGEGRSQLVRLGDDRLLSLGQKIGERHVSVLPGLSSPRRRACCRPTG